MPLKRHNILIFMKNFIFLTIFFLTAIACQAQNLIGLSSDEIKKYMTENRKEMSQDRVVNQSFDYLKYSDKSDTETILFFLSSDSKCSSIRIVCDGDLKQKKIKELDDLYSKKGTDSWTDAQNGKKYQIKAVSSEWSFSITIEPEN